VDDASGDSYVQRGNNRDLGELGALAFLDVREMHGVPPLLCFCLVTEFSSVESLYAMT
jgi:hypothetical protein